MLDCSRPVWGHWVYFTKFPEMHVWSSKRYSYSFCPVLVQLHDWHLLYVGRLPDNCSGNLPKFYWTFLAQLCAAAQQSYCHGAGVRRPTVKPVSLETVKQIGAKFVGKVLIHHIFQSIFCVLFEVYTFWILRFCFAFANMEHIGVNFQTASPLKKYTVNMPDFEIQGCPK